MKSIQKAAFVARRLPERMRLHNLTLVSAGVAFYAFLAFVPTLIAVVSVYGLVAEPADVSRQVDSFASALPDEVEKFISFQLKSIVESSRTGVSVTLAVALVIALWSASGGMAALITGAPRRAGAGAAAEVRGEARQSVAPHHRGGRAPDDRRVPRRGVAGRASTTSGAPGARRWSSCAGPCSRS